MARRLAASGYAVALHYFRNLAAIDLLGAECVANGWPYLAVQADLSVDTEVERLLNAVQNTWDRLDLLINNAGVYHEPTLMELAPEDWFAGFNSTASATFFTSRASVPMLRAAEYGRIINIGDAACDRLTARDRAVGYHIGKTGVLILTRSFAAQEAPYGTTVNLISPGYLSNSVGKPPVSALPSGRFGEFADIWNAVDFIRRPESSYLTGANLIVGGGWNL